MLPSSDAFILAALFLCCSKCLGLLLEDSSDENAVFAFIGDTFPVHCNHSFQDAGISDGGRSHLRLGVYRNGKKYTDIPTTTVSTTSSTTSSFLSSLQSSSSSSSSSPAKTVVNKSTDDGSNDNSYISVHGFLNVTEDLLGTSYIVCETEKDVVVRKTTLYVQGRLDRDVSNVSSVWLYESYDLHVTWVWPRDIVEEFLNATVVWSADVPPHLGGFQCKHFDESTCIIDNMRYPKTIYFRVSASIKPSIASKYHGLKIKNDEDVANSSTEPLGSGFQGVFNFSVNVLESVKTDIPRRFQLERRSSRCLEVTWVDPPFFENFQEESSYSIVARDMKGGDSNKSTHSLTWTGFHSETNLSVSLCQLKPDTEYILTVQVKPTGKGYWSDPANCVARTMEEIPEHGPVITSTSFWSGPCVAGERQVIVYWKDIPHDVARGELTGITVKFNNTEVKVRPKANHVVAELPCNKTYLVKVYPATEVGLTRVPSTLIIPSSDSAMKTPPDLDFKVTKVKDVTHSSLITVNVTWVCRRPVTCTGHFMDVYYCRGEGFSSNTCIDEIQHRRVPLQREFIFLGNIANMPDRFGFALSDKVGDKQGITWTKCVVDSSKIPSRPSGINVYRDSTDDTVIVRWNAPACADSNGALVQRYHVTYCRDTSSMQGSGACPAVTVEGSESSALIGGLDGNIAYVISVVAESSAGNSSSSVPVTLSLAETSSSSGSTQRNLFIIFGILAVLVLSAILVCVVRKLKQRMTLMKRDLWSVNLGIKYSATDNDSGCVLVSDPT